MAVLLYTTTINCCNLNYVITSKHFIVLILLPLNLLTQMSSKQLRQCPSCKQWFCPGSVGYTKHICTCQHQAHVYGSLDKEQVMSKNPVLSLTTKNQSLGNDYTCDLYQHQSYEDTNRWDDDNYSAVDDDCSSQCSDDSLDQYYLIQHDNQDNQDNQDTPPENESSQYVTPNRFQVMLHDIIMIQKSSLQMINDICYLVNDYISSPEFSNHTKLQSRKSFLSHIQL